MSLVLNNSGLSLHFLDLTYCDLYHKKYSSFKNVIFSLNMTLSHGGYILILGIYNIFISLSFIYMITFVATAECGVSLDNLAVAGRRTLLEGRTGGCRHAR